MRHQAIYELYPNVVQIKGNQQPTEQWDKDGNIVIIDENAVSTKESELQTEYDALDYARKRKAEYPSVQDLVVALYDTDDKTAIDEKRAEIKLKYPKPGA